MPLSPTAAGSAVPTTDTGPPAVLELALVLVAVFAVAPAFEPVLVDVPAPLSEPERLAEPPLRSVRSMREGADGAALVLLPPSPLDGVPLVLVAARPEEPP